MREGTAGMETTRRRLPLAGLDAAIAARQPAFPDLPAVAEAGVPGHGIATWCGLRAPAGTPAPAVAAMQRAAARAVRSPEALERMAGLGTQPAASGPAQFAALVRAEYDRRGRPVRDANTRGGE